MKYQGISIIKRKDCNTWCARFRKNGKQFYVSARTQQECYNKLKLALKKQKQIELKQLKEPKQKEEKSIKLGEWYEKWLEAYKIGKIKETTLMDYKSSLKYIKPIWNIELKNLSNIEITKTLNNIPFERRKQKVYEILNDVLNKAVKNKLIDNNQIIDEKPKHKRENGISLTTEDEKLFKNICNNENKIFLLCLYQGLRKGEALAITKNDFDFKNQILNINKSLNIMNKVDTTKNETSTRIMPLFKNTIDLLKSDIEKLDDNERLFNFSQAKTGKMFNSLREKYNLNKKYTIQSLRHTFVTKCQEANIPLHVIQRWVGHTIGSQVTNNVYTHFRIETEEKFKNILDNN